MQLLPTVSVKIRHCDSLTFKVVIYFFIISVNAFLGTKPMLYCLSYRNINFEAFNTCVMHRFDLHLKSIADSITKTVFTRLLGNKKTGSVYSKQWKPWKQRKFAMSQSKDISEQKYEQIYVEIKKKILKCSQAF